MAAHLRGDRVGRQPRMPRPELTASLPHYFRGLPAPVPPGGDGEHQAGQQGPIDSALPAGYARHVGELRGVAAERVLIPVELRMHGLRHELLGKLCR